MRFLAQLKAILSEDSDQMFRNLDFSQTIDDTLVTTEDGGTFTLAVSASNQAILFPKVTSPKYLVLIVWSGEITFKLNATTAPAIAIEPNPATASDPILPYQKTAQPGVVFLGPISTTAALTALYLSNPSASTPARVQVAFVGEAA